MTTATESSRPSSPRPGHAQATTTTSDRAAVTRTVALVVGLATFGDGLALVVLAFAGHPGVGTRIAELVFGLAVVVPGLWMARAGIRRQPVHQGALFPDVVLAGALLTLGVAMPAFHHGLVDYQSAVDQFVFVVVGLGLGSAGLVLSGVTAPTAERGGKLSFPGAVRDGVLLSVGTILLAISIGQLADPKLMPPMWNWISFVAITIPGMLVLVAREFVKQADRRSDHRGDGALAAACSSK